jgi:hypothetical protein
VRVRVRTRDRCHGPRGAISVPPRSVVLVAVIASLLPGWSAPPAGASTPSAVSEAACFAGGGSLSYSEYNAGFYTAGNPLTFYLTLTCTSSGHPPVAGFDTDATASPAGVLQFTSPTSASTGASGVVTYNLLGLKAGQVTVTIYADDGGLCAAKSGASSCQWPFPMKEQAAAPTTTATRPPEAIGTIPPKNPPSDAPWGAANPVPCAAPGRHGAPSIGYEANLACADYFVGLINVARAKEHVPPMQLPSNWAKLTIAEQLFVTADLERVGRRLPPYVGLSDQLDALAFAGTVAKEDPPPPHCNCYSAENYYPDGLTATDADYGWMYIDGVGGAAGCNKAGDPSCWGHRDNILGAPTGLGCTDCMMGAAGAPPHPNEEGIGMAEVLVAPPSPSTFPAYFTWAKDVVPYLEPTAKS